jgi:hypothetical protein
MIPHFDDRGYLPVGVHRAAVEEIVRRFGSHTELRRVQMDSLRWLIDAAQRAGVKRLVVNGSFVTDVLEPNDVDCVLLVDASFPRGTVAEDELLRGLPFLDIHLVDQDGFDGLVANVFATDRRLIPKGMVEVIL